MALRDIFIDISCIFTTLSILWIPTLIFTWVIGLAWGRNETFIFSLPSFALISIISALLYWVGKYREFFKKVRNSRPFWAAILIMLMGLFFSFFVILNKDLFTHNFDITILSALFVTVGFSVYWVIIDTTWKEGIRKKRISARLLRATVRTFTLQPLQKKHR